MCSMDHITSVYGRNADFCSPPELLGLRSKAHSGVFSGSPAALSVSLSLLSVHTGPVLH